MVLRIFMLYIQHDRTSNVEQEGVEEVERKNDEGKKFRNTHEVAGIAALFGLVVLGQLVKISNQSNKDHQEEHFEKELGYHQREINDHCSFVNFAEILENVESPDISRVANKIAADDWILAV